MSPSDTASPVARWQADAVSHPILPLWSAPRARSTVFLRSMAERGDLLALHEPFCNLADYGQTTVAGSRVTEPRTLMDLIFTHARQRPVFFKDTTDHRYPTVLATHALLAEGRHGFLIRRPEQIAASFYALQPAMVEGDIGLIQMHEIFEAVRSAGGTAVVIDSEDLFRSPATTMRVYCEAVGLTFRPEALSWRAGDRAEWAQSARWHQEAAASTGFGSARSTYRHTAENTPRLARFAALHEPAYQELRRHRVRV